MARERRLAARFATACTLAFGGAAPWGCALTTPVWLRLQAGFRAARAPLGFQLADWEEVMPYDLARVSAGSRPFFHLAR